MSLSGTDGSLAMEWEDEWCAPLRGILASSSEVEPMGPLELCELLRLAAPVVPVPAVAPPVASNAAPPEGDEPVALAAPVEVVPVPAGVPFGASSPVPPERFDPLSLAAAAEDEAGGPPLACSGAFSAGPAGAAGGWASLWPVGALLGPGSLRPASGVEALPSAAAAASPASSASGSSVRSAEEKPSASLVNSLPIFSNTLYNFSRISGMDGLSFGMGAEHASTHGRHCASRAGETRGQGRGGRELPLRVLMISDLCALRNGKIPVRTKKDRRPNEKMSA
mmetsp:Transcript_36167/g.112616  ORF Transcript_36167/g.112616 Transcript_36167/m.112616 type:complete len:280 (+) Transcript_36167:497-1336(+)